jgi:hypothetical protein
MKTPFLTFNVLSHVKRAVFGCISVSSIVGRSSIVVFEAVCAVFCCS